LNHQWIEGPVLCSSSMLYISCRPSIKVHWACWSPVCRARRYAARTATGLSLHKYRGPAASLYTLCP